MTTQPKPGKLGDDPLWYKDAVLYELHVRAFADSDDDGIGDFRGLTGKLDYLAELGVTALWLLPFYPSPLRDDGYDIADYRSIHGSYGDLADFKRFLKEAHRRGLRVITELVINHTSSEHPWFQRARRSPPSSPHRAYYVWSDSPDRYRDARIIFKDFETSNWTWDDQAEAYYWHRFYHHQPDLNFASPEVRRQVIKAMDFWLGLGVDGLRLDAVPYLFECEGTSCENLPETHAFLRELRRHVDRRFKNRMLLAEANQWPEDAIAYFGAGDECHMAFHFPVMPRLFMALRMEDRFPILDILEQTPAIPDSAQWALFLRNHDELTLEMVTDEDRDYMYRVYAGDPRARINLGIRRRLAPLLGNDRRRIELMNALLFSLPGTPVLYYGDEIGMGDNFYLGDRDGVRTPMQWSADRNAGFSRANPQKLYLPVIIDPEYHFEAINVEAQQANSHSLLWWTRRLIALRKRYRAFGRGSLEFLHPANPRVLAFLRLFEGERILVVGNLSRFPQHVELGLEAWEGVTPVELFGRTRFPRIGELPYLLTLGPHGFYWFSLGEEAEAATPYALTYAQARSDIPSLVVSGGWEACLKGKAREELEALLPGVLQGRRWFGGKARTIRQLSIAAHVPLEGGVRLLLLEVDYTEGEAETYALPLAFASAPQGERLLHDQPRAAVARLAVVGRDGVRDEGLLFDAVVDPGFRASLLDAIARRRSFRDDGGELVAHPGAAYRGVAGEAWRRGRELTSRVLDAEQSNSSIIYGDRLILKLFRKLEPGTNPDLEVGRFLTERTAYRHIAPVVGAIEYRRGRGEPWTLGILQGFVANEGDAWSYSLESVGRFFERVLSQVEQGELPPVPELSPRPVATAAVDLPPEASDLVGTYLVSAEILGRRTGELHLALASVKDAPEFAPEPFTTLYQRSLYQSMRSLAGRTFRLLETRRSELPEATAGAVGQLLAARDRVLERFAWLLGGKIDAQRIRCHGDYHLGQVLHTGKDFVIIDFEGEPARALSERRIKRSPLADVAGMLRSFDYAAFSGLERARDQGLAHPPLLAALEGWARFWQRAVAEVFLRSYLTVAGEAPFLPREPEVRSALLDVFWLGKAIYELGYELNNRPEWVRVPLAGITRTLGLDG